MNYVAVNKILTDFAPATPDPVFATVSGIFANWQTFFQCETNENKDMTVLSNLGPALADAVRTATAMWRGAWDPTFVSACKGLDNKRIQKRLQWSTILQDLTRLATAVAGERAAAPLRGRKRSFETPTPDRHMDSRLPPLTTARATRTFHVERGDAPVGRAV